MEDMQNLLGWDPLDFLDGDMRSTPPRIGTHTGFSAHPGGCCVRSCNGVRGAPPRALHSFCQGATIDEADFSLVGKRETPFFILSDVWFYAEFDHPVRFLRILAKIATDSCHDCHPSPAMIATLP